ncbi:MAG TPA: heavy metal translocating P-type ATPase [Longimicrobiales bacterium]
MRGQGPGNRYEPGKAGQPAGSVVPEDPGGVVTPGSMDLRVLAPGGSAAVASGTVAAAEPGLAVLSFGVEGMDCSSCAATVEKALRGVDGVRDVQVDVMGGRVTVSYAAGSATWPDLAGAVVRAGYRVRDEAPPASPEAAPRAASGPSSAPAVATSPPTALAGVPARMREAWARHGRLALVVASGVCWTLSLLAAHLFKAESAAGALAIGSIVFGGRYIVPKGLRAARTGALDMNFLMTLAAAGALGIGEWGEAAAAMFLFAVAQHLEAASMDRARRAIRALMDLSPAEATVIRDGVEVRIPAAEVRVGETVVVRPGEKIPVDGRVLAGVSEVDQSPITGESIPVPKEPGAEVFAGTLNGDGALEVLAEKPAEDTTLARIIHAVEEAQATRAPSQAFVDRFARVYTPAVVAIAALLAVVPPLVAGAAWGEWFYRALVLLVVACPCALVISTPVTIVSALAGAARDGILIKGGLHLENAGRARVVALDKTGTLTEGRPAVVDVTAFDGTGSTELLALAAAAEARSTHPIAHAILRRAEEEGCAVPSATDAVAIPGKGHRARVGDVEVLVGSERLFEELGVDLAPHRALLDAHAARGRTAVIVATRAVDDAGPPRLRGVIAVADRIRPTAASALRALHAAGIERVVMLTGDYEGAARAIADELGGPGVGVDEIRAGLLPEEKVAAVRELRERHARVLFVGDGINDAPALAAADVGVAMGSAGTDVALDTADIALMDDDLSRLPVAIQRARKAERIVRVNIAFALGTKAVFVVLAAAGAATLWMAVLADMGASLLVVGNGLRALRG